MSFAIIETGGKQYKVSASKILEVELLGSEKGKTIQFKNVLLLNDDKNTEDILKISLDDKSLIKTPEKKINIDLQENNLSKNIKELEVHNSSNTIAEIALNLLNE